VLFLLLTAIRYVRNNVKDLSPEFVVVSEFLLGVAAMLLSYKPIG
jgi:hypothetical protein